MATITIELPEDLADRLRSRSTELPRIIEAGLNALQPSEGPIYSGMADVLSFLSQLPGPEAVLELRASPLLQSRVEALVAKSRTEGLSEAEEREWQQYEQLEHRVVTAKLHARQRLLESA